MPLIYCALYKSHDDSSNGDIFRVIGLLCGEFTGPRWIPCKKACGAEFDVFFDMRLNKPLSKQWWGWWFKTLSRPLWCHCNDVKWCYQDVCVFAWLTANPHWLVLWVSDTTPDHFFDTFRWWHEYTDCVINDNTAFFNLSYNGACGCFDRGWYFIYSFIYISHWTNMKQQVYRQFTPFDTDDNNDSISSLSGPEHPK